MRKLFIKQCIVLVEKLFNNLHCPRKCKNLPEVNMIANDRSKLIFAVRNFEMRLFSLMLTLVAF